MAGHSKWANIQHRKNAQDAKRGKVFTKLIREITVAAGIGGADLSSNPRLRTAIDKALSNNMTRDTIDRAVKRGVGGLDGQNVESVRYEGYGPGGVAVLVECLTDNRNRTVGEVRHAFTKCGGNLGTDGSVAYLFNKMGQMTFAPGVSADKVLEIALDAGADDVLEEEDGSIEVTTSAQDFESVKAALEAQDLQPALAEVAFRADVYVELQGEQKEKMEKMIDMLEDLDDVQEVVSNAK